MEAAMQFVAKIELYHLDVGDMPWLDVKYYFRPLYEVSNSPFRNLDTKAINNGNIVLIREVDLMDSTLGFYTLNQNGAGKTSYLRLGMYELDLDDIYSAIRKHGRITATPQSIGNTILKPKR